MLNLKKLKKQWRVVKCKIPSEGSETGFETVEFRAQFKLLTMDQFKKMTESFAANAKQLEKDLESGQDVSDSDIQKQAVSFLDEILLDVKDVEVEDGESPVEMVKKTIWPMNALVQHYMQMMRGIEEENLKKPQD